MTVDELLEKYQKGWTDFRNIQLPEANLCGVKLSGADFSHGNLSVVNLSGANLTKANFSYAQLNVARLSGAHLEGANLTETSLNVANLIRANLSHAQLVRASLIQSELIRADFTRANLLEANLSNADLREATLRHAILRNANLNQACLRGASLVAANLERATLNNTDLVRADLSGANLREAELRQVNMFRANLFGANLSDANLRWADLRGANLSWTDLSGAKLSGANLAGADLSNANLTNTSLVHTDLTEAKLIEAEWVGADLTGATLTGAKLYATSRFGLKTDMLICEWVDLSQKGDRSIIHYLTAEDSGEFFNETPPTIRIIVDRPLDPEANFALAGAYFQITQKYQGLHQPPSMEIGRRRTVFTFRADSDESLFPIAYMAILPFKDAAATHKNIYLAIEMIASQENHRQLISIQRMQQLMTRLDKARENADYIKGVTKILGIAAKLNFFQAPTQTILTNSSAKNLTVYDSPHFGKRLIDHPQIETDLDEDELSELSQSRQPSINASADFFKGFHYLT
ncbi:MAG: pentapeptide repeat-containing protein [Richelia sp. RM2_1_2]|nr:pentapeptide repeat-containing protein [Richelia sp. SM1_7_0]NJN09971.1 pentapeptide repeat-containing protein [Richelia sp. RM1_1_1]NJO31494.1 pentapeptide repeat-containing protein [Richelia sp. SL_2_1]NJO62119.1 pentapeptide repeat-containing protein [Richelia sp. RM2_1_2]